MEKRYQVFISSTFRDLADARQEVSQALLRANCFPAGMELFPAADEEQFNFIKSVIDESDYYIIISAGVYGTIHPQYSISYTELEYDYAVSTGKPVIRLLHKSPFSTLPGNMIDQDQSSREQLERFRTKLSESSLVRFWSDPIELGAEVVYGLMHVQKSKPAAGWIRGDRPRIEDEREILQLRTQVIDLQKRIEMLEKVNERVEEDTGKIDKLYESLTGLREFQYLSPGGDLIGAVEIENRLLLVLAMIAVKSSYLYNEVMFLLTKIVDAYGNDGDPRFGDAATVKFSEGGLGSLFNAMEIAGCYITRMYPINNKIDQVVGLTKAGEKWLIKRFEEHPDLYRFQIRRSPDKEQNLSRQQRRFLERKKR